MTSGSEALSKDYRQIFNQAEKLADNNQYVESIAL